MTDEEEEVRLAFAGDVLRNTLVLVFVQGGRSWSEQTFREISEFIEIHRRDCRRRLGIRVPRLVPVLIPRFKMVHLARADYPLVEVRKLAILLCRWHPDLTHAELRAAMKRAYPHMPIDDLCDEATFFQARRQGSSMAAPIAGAA